jgi:hypothetical protein
VKDKFKKSKLRNERQQNVDKDELIVFASITAPLSLFRAYSI